MNRKNKAHLFRRVTCLPRRLSHGRLPAHQRVEETYRSQAKSGTTHFHAYATASIVRRGQRFTVALIRVEYGTPMVEVLKRSLHLLRQAGIRPRLLLLDRGSQALMSSATCIEHATRLSCRWFVGGAPPMTHGVPAVPTSLLPPSTVAGITSTLTNADKRTATVLICVHCRNWQGVDGRGANPWFMPVGGSISPAPPGFIKPTVGASELRPATAYS